MKKRKQAPKGSMTTRNEIQMFLLGAGVTVTLGWGGTAALCGTQYWQCDVL